MALHPGEAGHDERFEEKAAASEEKRQGCTDMSARNRRADTRMSDIHRAAEKAVPDSPKAGYCTTEPPACGGFGNLKPNPELQEMLEKEKSTETMPLKESYDKNSSASLKQLRWEIYDLIERYEGDYGRTISMTLRSEVEDLFKKYTHS